MHRYQALSLALDLGLLAGLGFGRPNEADWVQRTIEAASLTDKGQYEEAATVLERAADEAGDTGARAAALSSLGVVYGQLGRYAEAERVLRKAIRLSRQEGGDKNPDLIIQFSNLAAIYIDSHRYAKAKPLLMKAVALHQRVSGEDPLNLVAILNNLGKVEHAQGNLNRAEVHYSEALTTLERRAGSSHPWTPALLLNIGVLYRDTGKLAGAISYIRQALEIWMAAHGRSHPNIANGRRQLARALTDGQRFPEAEAEAEFRESLEIAESSLGPEHPRTGEILWHYGDLLRQIDRKQEAREMKKRAKAILERNEKENLLHHTIDWSQLRKP